MQKSDFFYSLPPELIAQEPLADRAASRMLVLDPKKNAYLDSQVVQLQRFLRPGDVLVFNNTKVLPARLLARKETGGAVELLLDRILTTAEARFLARSSKPLRVGMKLQLADGSQAEVLSRDGKMLCLRRLGDWLTLLEGHGSVPLPPYIQRPAEDLDRERYQTVYAQIPGAVAAPTAGLHFDESLLTALASFGIHSSFVTLHVGAGTFLPVQTEQIEEHQMHSEIAEVSAATVAAVQACKDRGGRVIAVGTTACRALESAAQTGVLQPFTGDTDLFLYPGKSFRVIDGLFTNFHLPESTLLMLVCALAGTDFVLAAYHHAVAQQYRFFSYGDAMLIVPGSLL
ncbi:MAG: tRNA preQ1(34) S-adenosylmethionine ribosyltransferase-isomerase QueA [Acidithiobacillus sp.]|nr:tRNA preQ1(34) S-adenosylmethionine ribosyltransferase-isomerase QueA [Acidithiobacillus sp.]